MNARDGLVHAIYPEAEGPGTNELIDDYRAEVLTEAADVAEHFTERWPDMDAMKADGVIGPHTAFKRIADELREMAGKDIRGGSQPSADESTQPEPDLFSRVHTALSDGHGPLLPLPESTVRVLTARVVDAITPLVPYRPVWDSSFPPGGSVCSICGDPVESEPCPQHAPSLAGGRAPAADRIIAYQSSGGRILRCLAHNPNDTVGDFHPVTADDLPDGGICTYPDCGADVLTATDPISYADTCGEPGGEAR